nr:hypothetical protein B0A51_05380 [Rachicladosporium sp. CCFEE 5018]
MATMNGHANGHSQPLFSPSPVGAGPDSPLSDVNDAVPEVQTIHPQDIAGLDEDAAHDMATSELEEDDEGDEQDADFDEETPPPVGTNGVHHDGSSSDEDIRPNKRKALVNDDDLMKENPELYGLRRSGRARPSRRLADTSDEDHDSDAINTGSRRKRQKTSGHPASTRLSNVTSGQDDDSEADDAYGGAKGRAFAKKHRKMQGATSGAGTPQLGEVRFSSRRAGKVTTYNDDDELGLSDEMDTEDIAENYIYEPVGPAVDLVLNHRERESTDPENPLKNDPLNPHKKDFEYLIKWQSQAHYHATWENWDNLKDLKGFRRVENYFRKIILLQIDMLDPDMPPETREKWNLDRETYLEELSEYSKVERVIGAEEGDAGMEYYVKWKSLPYDFCTWEAASLVSDLAQGEIDRYLDRSSRHLVSNARESSLATRSDYKPFRVQPEYIVGGQLREFQIHGLNFLAHHWCKGNNVILADEMGLGKTVQTVSFMEWLRRERGQQGPFIVVVPLSTMHAWADTFNFWTPELNYVVYNGNDTARKIIRDHELLVDPRNYKKTKFNVMLTTYEYVLQDSGFLSQLKWQFMAVDEAHRLKNRDSQLYAKLREFGSPSRLLITGTPMQNTLSELAALMDFLMPGKITVDEGIDLASEGAGQKIAELTNAISPYMIRRTKQKVESDLPPKTEKIIRVELADVQLEYYKNILTRNYAALNAGPKAQKTSLLNIMMELKKASNHAFMFPNAEERILDGTDGTRDDQLKALITSSGKMMLLDRLLTKLKKDGHRVLIFSQMVKMLDILGDYLNLRGYQFQRLDGTIAAGPRRVAIEHFNAPGSQDFTFLLSTRAGGLGINLMTADTVILFDSDWNPQADLQAMARAHRIGQKNPVTIYRLVSKDTVEEEVLERARNKLMLEFITIQRGVTDKDNSDLREKLVKAGEKAVEPTSSDEISRILKKRGQKMFEQSGNQRKLEELDIDAVLENAEEHKTEQPEGMTTDGGEEFLRSFEYTDVKLDLEWDQIIPKNELDKIKEEERKAKEAADMELIIGENQPRKRRAPVDEAREQRAAKKRARDLAAEAAAADASSDEESDRGADPKRPLGEKECRNLIRAFERYGHIEERREDVLREARLLHRDYEVVRATLHEVIDLADKLLREEADRVADLERSTGKPITKKERKSILFDFRGVKRINAETIKERPADMHMIAIQVAGSSDIRNFRIPEAQKPATYTCSWGAREDGMLVVGISRHGMGAWSAIRDDPELQMSDKLFLEEHRVGQKEEREKGEQKLAKSPGAVHLVRRSGYLVSVLRDKTSNGANEAARRALENHHRNNRKHGSFHGRTSLNGPLQSASPGPGQMRKPGHHDHRGQMRPQSQGSPNGHTRPMSAIDHERIRQRQAQQPRPGHHRTHSSHLTNGAAAAPPVSEADKELVATFATISDTLKMAVNCNKRNFPDDKVRLANMKTSLVTIGKHIDGKAVGDEKLHARLWDWVSDRHWPQSKKVEQKASGSTLKAMYEKIAKNMGPPAAPAASAASTAGGAAKVEVEVKEEDGKENGAVAEVKKEVVVKDDLKKADV